MAWRNIRTGTTAATPPAFEYSDKGTGGLVVELYNPWTGITANGLRACALPAEFQATASGSSGFMPASQIDLAKVVTVSGTTYPVFQLLAVAESGTTTLKNLVGDPTWPKAGVSGTLPGLVIYPANTTDLPVTGSNGTFASRDGPNVDSTTLRPGQFAIVSGPIASGSGTLANTIDISASGTAEMQFSYANFSDSTARQAIQLSGSLSEVITGSNGYNASDRSSARQYPADAGSGPVGALVCVENISQASAPLRFVAQSGTTADLNYMAAEKYRILLRRLANPQRGYDADTNPYVCIDSLVVQDQAVVAGATGGTPGRLRSAERCAAQPADKSANNLWRHTAADDDANVLALAPPRMGPVTGIEASLGFLPARLKVPSDADDPAEVEQPAFPWLTWLNREFSSIHELFLVPGSSPASLLQEHSHEWPFPHLFFQLGSGTSDSLKELEQNKAGILELLRVPSRFADTEMRISPAEAIAISGTLGANGGRPMFLPPHNYLSDFREPGRVNLNTTSSSSVWSAINNGRPGSPYEDEVAYDNNGQPLSFQKSEDWSLDTAAISSPASGTWTIDSGSEDINGNGRLDLNHDVNNDGRQQASISGKLRSIASSRRGWPITADIVSGQFDRVLNRRGVANDQLWFSQPFQSGWLVATGTTDNYFPDRSLLLRSWSADESSNFMRIPSGANYRWLRRDTGVALTANTEYICVIRMKGNVTLAAMGSDKLPELIIGGGPAMLDPYDVQRSFADGVTVYTARLRPSQSITHRLQIAINSPMQVDVLSVSLTSQTTGAELLSNSDFSAGQAGWEGDAVLQVDASASKAGPVYLMGTNFALKDSKGKSQWGRPYADPKRNPYFRYREMMRLSNLTTQRSNVFAVWMTIGFFVIEPHPTKTGQTALGQEYGLDTGKAARFKSFMIIDRSIPVGFRPGVPGNSRDAILLEHFGN
jgi:hypothetical protein